MIFSSFARYFTDPVLQAPTLGSMLMCLSSALVGVIVFLRKKSLLGEALSHAAYPGVVLSVVFMSLFLPIFSHMVAFGILVGASLTALLALWVIEKMEGALKVKSDAALCFVLSIFFGVGVLIASRIQFTHALWYKTVQIFLYGQAATMTTIHVWLYALLSILLICSLFILYRPLQMAIFDPIYSRVIGVAISFLDAFLFFLLVLAIVIGIRSVGVVLMAGMLIAPAVAARQWSHRLWVVFTLAGILGAVSGFMGNYLSVEMPFWFGGGFSLPTGPMILLSAAAICLFSLLFSRRLGLVSRLWRIMRFKRQCLEDNVLKYLWRLKRKTSFSSLRHHQHLSWLQLQLIVWNLKRKGWVFHEQGISLTHDGSLKAARIVRLHRLWEVYLVSLGQGAEKVHRSAEEMEHIITPNLEKQLSDLLGDPKKDPHAQPIPSAQETV